MPRFRHRLPCHRSRLRAFLSERFPDSGAIEDGAKAVVDTLVAGGLARADRERLSFGLRDIPLGSLAFILHSELPEPGMYDVARIEASPLIKTMLWRDDRILPTLYELRNRGGITKLSEIDSVRQVTTHFTLEQAVGWIISEGIA